MTGTANQVEWAEQIKIRVSADFDRVARALASAASRQTEEDRVDTLAVIAILEEKRAAVMGKDEAGYFIHDWQELSDQVRRMIAQDPRYKRIKINKELARRISQINPDWRLNSMLKIRPLSDRIVVKRIAEQETLRSGIIIPIRLRKNRGKQRSSPSGKASAWKTAQWFLSMSKSAIAFCSARIPAATSNWMAKSI